MLSAHCKITILFRKLSVKKYNSFEAGKWFVFFYARRLLLVTVVISAPILYFGISDTLLSYYGSVY